MKDSESSAVAEKLDQLIRLVAYQITNSEDSKADKIKLLAQLGLESALIAKVCDTAPNVVRARLSEVKKQKKGKK